MAHLQNNTSSSNDNNEIWRDVPGYEGSYQVSNMGRIRSLPRTCTVYGGVRTVPGKILKPSQTTYLHVTLSKDGIHTAGHIHEMVARVFIGTRPSGYYVHHKDGNRHNNRVDNLEYVTPRDHQVHHVGGERNWNARLTADDVRKIRKLLADKVNVNEIAKQFGISAYYVRDLKRGRWWKHVD